jgi:hypothetical protein
MKTCRKGIGEKGFGHGAYDYYGNKYCGKLMVAPTPAPTTSPTLLPTHTPSAHPTSRPPSFPRPPTR